MYITIDNEKITGIFCGDKQDNFITVSDTFCGLVGDSIIDYNSTWDYIGNDMSEIQLSISDKKYNFLTLIEEIEQGVSPIPIGYKIQDGSLATMSLAERVEAGQEKLPIGWKITGDCISEMTDVEKMIADIIPIPDGYEIKENKLIEIITPEKQKLIDKQNIITRLTEIDTLTIRPLRATLAGTQTEQDTVKLLQLENEATELRNQLKEI